MTCQNIRYYRGFFFCCCGFFLEGGWGGWCVLLNFFFFDGKSVMSMFCNVIMLLLLSVHVCVTRTGWKTRPRPKTVILLIKKSNQIKSNQISPPRPPLPTTPTPSVYTHRHTSSILTPSQIHTHTHSKTSVRTHEWQYVVQKKNIFMKQYMSEYMWEITIWWWRLNSYFRTPDMADHQRAWHIYNIELAPFTLTMFRFGLVCSVSCFDMVEWRSTILWCSWAQFL